MEDPIIRFEPDSFVLLITGASKGLGRAIAQGWARPGARIAITARGAAGLLATQQMLEEKGAAVFSLPGDVGQDGFAEELVHRSQQALGPVTHLVTCASSLGPLPLGPVADVQDAAWDEVLRTNILGMVRLWRTVLPSMEGHLRGGRLVHVSSDAAVEAYPHWGPYGATKAAADHLVRILAAEFSEHLVENVHVYSVDPGDMDTDMHRAAIPNADPADLLRPEAVAPAFLDLLLQDPPLPSGRYRAADLPSHLAGGRP